MKPRPPWVFKTGESLATFVLSSICWCRHSVSRIQAWEGLRLLLLPSKAVGVICREGLNFVTRCFFSAYSIVSHSPNKEHPTCVANGISGAESNSGHLNRTTTSPTETDPLQLRSTRLFRTTNWDRYDHHPKAQYVLSYFKKHLALSSPFFWTYIPALSYTDIYSTTYVLSHR